MAAVPPGLVTVINDALFKWAGIKDCVGIIHLIIRQPNYIPEHMTVFSSTMRTC